MKTGPAIIVTLSSLAIMLLIRCTPYKYFAQHPPSDTPQVFAPGIISLPGRNEEVVTFSPDLKEIYYSVEFYPDPRPSFILHTKFANGKWSKPDTVSFSKGRRTSEPFMAFNGKRIYYFANNVADQKGVLDICYSERVGNSWSLPISLSAPPNFVEPNYSLHPCIIGDTSIYYSSHSGNICKSAYRNGQYEKVEVLDKPINHLNSSQEECWGDPFVDKNETMMIFRSNRTGGYGGSDLYITFKSKEGAWSSPKNLGPKINSEFDELGGDITPDGKYMTFGRNGDIYWVSTSFIEKMKKE